MCVLVYVCCGKTVCCRGVVHVCTGVRVLW